MPGKQQRPERYDEIRPAATGMLAEIMTASIMLGLCLIAALVAKLVL